MHLIYVSTIPLLWVAFAISVLFAIGTRKSKPSVRQESIGHRLLRIAIVVPVLLFMAPPRLPGGFLSGRIIPWHPANFWIGTVMVLAGFWLATYCRHFLKENWSIAVEVKRSHQLIQDGPYRFVRHPIYAGLLLAVLGSALAIGQWRGLIGFLIALAALWSQARAEERYMTETFGEAYLQYQTKVPALLPSLRGAFRHA